MYADNYYFDICTPVVKGSQTGCPQIDGLPTLAEKFNDNADESLEQFINTQYTAQIRALHVRANGKTSDYGAPAFRIHQIIEDRE